MGYVVGAALLAGAAYAGYKIYKGITGAQAAEKAKEEGAFDPPVTVTADGGA
jgi:hypothetical protein